MIFTQPSKSLYYRKENQILSTQDFLLKAIKLIFIFLLPFILVSCGAPSQVSIHSVDAESCFVNYKNGQDLNIQMTKLQEAIEGMGKPNPLFKTLLGCLHFQSGNFLLAEQTLVGAYTEAKAEKNKYTIASALAPSALGLIYLKQLQTTKITEEIINDSKSHPLGKWMTILYHIDAYRTLKDTEHLAQAIEVMQMKIQEEGFTEEKGFTEDVGIFLNQMESLLNLETTCSKDDKKNTLDGCGSAIKEKKGYLFSLSVGLLIYTLKLPPLNNESDTSDRDIKLI